MKVSILKTKLLLSCFAVLIFSACVSNKKHLAAIEVINSQHQLQVAQLQEKIDTSANSIKELELNLAERIGENNILLILRNELQVEIEDLEASIENLSSTSSSKQKNLSSDLAKKDKQIQQLKNLLGDVESTIVQYEDIIKQITSDLNYIAQDYPDDIDVSLGFDFAIIDIKESFLFKRNSATRLTDSGLDILEKFSGIFEKFPRINVQVIGHTDTDPPKDKKRYKDNWNFSALQSATVVRTLIDEFDISSNQLTLAAKADSAPKASNATTDGKLKNRRIEMYLTMDSRDLAKAIRAVLAKE